MTSVFHELLPESYLLILVPGTMNKPEAALEHSLGAAQRSGKPAVWVDCSQLKSLSDEATELLWTTHYELQRKRARLVLVHVAEGVRREILDHHLGPAPCMVPTLREAALQTRKLRAA